MSDKIYPALYRVADGNEYIYVDKDNYYSYQRSVWDKTGSLDDHKNDTNITCKYLTDTYGEVKSKEHAEFIVKLAEVNGFGVIEDYESGVMWFSCDRDTLDFYRDKNIASNAGEKQITIPIPPKCDEPLNNGDNLLFGGEDKCKEWPAVGDEVLAPFNRVSVKATVCWQRVNESGMHVSLVFNNDYKYFWCVTEDLQKPKTPEEELRDELASDLNKMQLVSNLVKANELMAKYNITKKPQ